MDDTKLDLLGDKTFKPNSIIHRLRDHKEELDRRRESGLIRGEHVGFKSLHQHYTCKKGSTTYIIAPPGSGKALRLDSKLFTKNGVMLNKDIKIGDEIYDESGVLTKVIGVHPQGKIRGYTMYFSDGTSIDSSHSHLWQITDFQSRGDGIDRVKTTEEIFNSPWKTVEKENRPQFKPTKNRYNYGIRLTEPVQYPEKDLPIHPYTIGALIGDGSLTTASVSITDFSGDVIDEISKYNEVNPRADGNSYGILGISDLIKELGLRSGSHDKKIPSDYLYASKEQRIDLFQGLMDTDGTVSEGQANFSYSTVSKQLAEDVAELGRSLGLFSQLKIKRGRYKGAVHLSYRISFKHRNMFNPFRIDVKLSKLKVHNKRNIMDYKKIVDIKPMEYEVEMQCISVDNDSKLYLTDDYLVTHNTYLTYEFMLNLAEFSDYKVAIFSPEGGSPSDLFAEMLWSYLRTPFQKTHDRPDLPEATDAQVEAGYKFMEEHFYIIDSGLQEMNPSKYFQAIQDIEAEDGIKIDAAVIDPVLEININPDNLREDVALNAFLTRIRKFSSENQIHTFISIHTRAMQSIKGTLQSGEEKYYYPQATFFDAAGGQTYSRKGYMIISLWRPPKGLPKPDTEDEYYVDNELVVEVLKVKPKIMGKLGKISLHFDRLTSRFSEMTPYGELKQSRDIMKEMSEEDKEIIPI